MVITVLQITSEAEKLIEKAGRICYLSEPKEDSAGRFIKARLKSGHESIVEHAVASFHIKGISRACSHQLVRHRLVSFSQQSQRYVDKDLSYVTPPTLEGEALQVFKESMEHSIHYYKKLRTLGALKEDARFVLPNAMATQLVATANFREWRHFLKIRLEADAQWEIREMAQYILDYLYEAAPSVFEDIIKEGK